MKKEITKKIYSQKYSFLKKIIFILLILNLYFFVSVFIGKNSVINYIKFNNKIKKLEKERGKLISSRYQMEQLRILLRKKSIDPDLLDEILRQNLQMSLPNEKLILLK